MRTAARKQAVAAAAARLVDVLGPEAIIDAHGLLMSVYKDPSQPLEIRIEAARAAIPYERPRLTAVTANLETGLTLAELVARSLHGAERETEPC